MRLVEFASAADQLALWKLISDTVWNSINTQNRQQAQVAAQQKRAVKPKKKVASKVKIPRPPIPKPLPQAKPLYPAKPAVAQTLKAPTQITQKPLTAQLTAKSPNLNTTNTDKIKPLIGIAAKDSTTK